jgi:hypothetical protein
MPLLQSSVPSLEPSLPSLQRIQRTIKNDFSSSSAIPGKNDFESPISSSEEDRQRPPAILVTHFKDEVEEVGWHSYGSLRIGFCGQTCID